MGHSITRDFVARVNGPGWDYGLARILIDDQRNAAVFVPPATNGPVQLFVADTFNPASGTGVTADGGRVSYQRRGAACSFALARCNVTTTTLTTRWDAVDTVPVDVG